MLVGSLIEYCGAAGDDGVDGAAELPAVAGLREDGVRPDEPPTAPWR
jgi:hypothetical protein